MSKPVPSPADSPLLRRLQESCGVCAKGKTQKQQWIETVLSSARYETLPLQHKSDVVKFIMRATGYSRAQVGRFIAAYRVTQNTPATQPILTETLSSTIVSDEAAPDAPAEPLETIPVALATRRLPMSKLLMAAGMLTLLTLGIRTGRWLSGSAVQLQGNPLIAVAGRSSSARSSAAGTVRVAAAITQPQTNPAPVTAPVVQQAVSPRMARIIAATLGLSRAQNGQVLTAQNGKFTWKTPVQSLVPTPTDRPNTVRTSDGTIEPAPRRGGGGGGGGGGTTTIIQQQGGITGPIAIDADTTGTLPVNRGGTNFTSYGTGDLLVGNGQGTLSRLARGNAGEVLSVSGSIIGWLSVNAASQAGNDARYVRKGGDTMTGALRIIVNGLGINVSDVASGATLFAQKSLRSSGSLVVAGTSYLQGNVGVGISSPKTKLEVTGTISGALVNVSSGYQMKGVTILSTKGSQNFFGGEQAGVNFLSGSKNTVLGYQALGNALASSFNIAIGYQAMQGQSNTTVGNENVAIGAQALLSIRGGSFNIAIGDSALVTTSSGSSNIGIGVGALSDNALGNNNVAIGDSALYNNNAGWNNTGLGHVAGQSLITGSGNTFLGALADAGVSTLTNATAIGYRALVRSNNAVILGSGANVGIGASTPKTKLEVVGTVSGSSLTVTGLKNCDSIDTNSNGNLVCGTDASGGGGSFGSGNVLTLGNRNYVRKSGDIMTGGLLIVSAPHSMSSIKQGLLLEIGGTLSGADLLAQKSLRSSGTLAVSGNTFLQGNVSVGTAAANYKLDVQSLSSSYLLGIGDTLTGQRLQFSNIAIDSFGGALGSDLYLNPSGGKVAIGKQTAAHAALEVVGSLSGTTLTLTTLKSCDSIDTDSAGNLICGTDATGGGGGTFGSGNVLAIGNRNYVKKSGDTMTGALAIKKLSGTATGNILIVDTNGLVYDATNKRVGIGTASPGAKLEVNDYMRVTGNATAPSGGAGLEFFYDAGNGVGGIVTYNRATATYYDTRIDGANLIFQISGTDKMKITSAGNVGIGKTSPNAKLDVLGTISGSSLTITGLKNCDSIDTDLNGNLVCGTDASGGGGSGTFGSGNVLAIGNSTYIRKSGDTMTGALIIKPSAGNAALGLTVNGVISGATLRILATATNTTDLAQWRIGATSRARVTKNGEFSNNGPGTGILNELFGSGAGARLTSAIGNAAFGSKALFRTTTGGGNAAFGISALETLTTGGENTAVGEQSLFSLVSGVGNIGIGPDALYSLTASSFNESYGYNSLFSLTSGSYNVALGHNAGANGPVTSTGTLFLGAMSDSSIATLTNATAIGYKTFVSASNSLILGSGANVGIGTSAPKAKLEVIGTISGSALRVSGLKNCDSIDTDLNGNLVCGTDASGGGGTFGTGNVISIVSRVALASSTGSLKTNFGFQFVQSSTGSLKSFFDTLYFRSSTGSLANAFKNIFIASSTGSLRNSFDNRYVNTSGDTMTGALRISAAGIGLRVSGTMSGKALVVTGSGAKSLFVADATTGKIGIGTSRPDSLLTMSGSNAEFRMLNGDYSRLSRTAAGNVLTLSNRVLQPAAGGYALSFDGSATQANMPNAGQYDSTTGTWMGWFKTATTGQYTTIMMRTDASNSNNGIGVIVHQDGTLYAFFKTVSSQVGTLQSAATVNDNTWHHWAVTFDGTSTATMYLDGTAVSTTNPFSWAFGANPIRLGVSQDSFWGKFNGTMDDVRTYSRVLSSGEVSAIYNGGSQTEGGTTSGITGWWKFNEGAGSISSDYSGYANTASLTSPTWVSNSQATSVQEAQVFTSIDGVDANERGILKLGDPQGGTWLQGTTLRFVTNTVERARFTADGSFGIGTTAPKTKLEVNGTISGSSINVSRALQIDGVNVLTGQSYFQSYFFGSGAGLNNAGFYNVGMGVSALKSNTSGAGNTALGGDALTANTTGQDNTAIGNSAMYSNVTGYFNTAVGKQSLGALVDGLYNVSVGGFGLVSLQTGSENTALGTAAGFTLTSGTGNLFLGASTNADVSDLTNATAIGYKTIVSASNTLVLGSGANVIIGAKGSATTKLEVQGTISGSSLTVSGLVSCAALQTNAAGALSCGSGGGLTQTNADSRYVNTSGDTMTGALTIRPSAGSTALGLAVNGIISGSTLRILATSTNVTDLAQWKIGSTIRARITKNGEFSNNGPSPLVGSIANEFFGSGAGLQNLNGAENSGFGNGALFSNTTGNDNAAFGMQTLYSNVGGGLNTAIGNFALNSSTNANNNTAVGYYALGRETLGGNNTAIGYYALNSLSTGNLSTALGFQAGANTFQTGTGTLFLGAFSSGAILNNAAAIGYKAVVRTSNSIVLGSGANVGIGTSSPSSKLTVVGTISGSALRILSTSATSVPVTIQASTANQTTDLTQWLLSGSQIRARITKDGQFSNAGPGSAYHNELFGSGAGLKLTSGQQNTAVGYGALRNASFGATNTAVGDSALSGLTGGSQNIAIGVQALTTATNANGNVGVGIQTLFSTTLGSFNTAIGNRTGYNNTRGSGITLLGAFADVTVTNLLNATAIGYTTRATTSNTLILGSGANVGIGTSAPSSKLTVVGTISGSALRILSTSGLSAALTIQAPNTTKQLTDLTQWVLTGSQVRARITKFGEFSNKGPGTGLQNELFGSGAGRSMTTATNNVGIGYDVMRTLSTGGSNTAIGAFSFISNTVGASNTALGAFTLDANINGSFNTALGGEALGNMLRGDFNTAVGMYSFLNKTDGSKNAALGYSAGRNSDTGTGTLFLGADSDSTISNLRNAAAIGYKTLVSASNSLILGSGANVGIGISAPKTKLEVVGVMSGSSLTVSGLKACAALQTDSAGALSCSSGGGLTQTNADARYVKKQGDTMTGALNIRFNGLGLTVTGTMSGRSLQITGTGSSPLLFSKVTTGRIGIGTVNPMAIVHIVGNNPAPATSAATGLTAEPSLLVTGSVGGSTSNNGVVVLGGAGGGVALFGGTGGTLTVGASINSVGGFGGDLLFKGGKGANVTSSATFNYGGQGGYAYLLGGDGGRGAGGTNNNRGNGGAVVIQGGTGGIGGDVLLSGGSGASAVPGNVILGINSSYLQMGKVGIGLSTPGALLSVSGATIMGKGVMDNVTMDSGLLLEILGTASGRVFHAQDQLRSSGTLVVKGAVTFTALASCTALQTNSNGALSCGAGGLNTALADARYVNTSGDTMTGGLLIVSGSSSATIDAGLLLEIAGTMSGRTLRAQDAITSSGTVAIGLKADAKGLVIRGSAGQSANLQEWQNSAGTVLASIDKAGSGFLTALGVGGPSYAGFGRLQIRAADDTAYSAAGLAINTPTTMIYNESQAVGAYAQLELLTRSSGVGVVRLVNINQGNTDADFAIDVNNSEMLRIDGSTGFVGIGTSAPKAKLDVSGTISGSTLKVMSIANSNANAAITVNSTIENGLAGWWGMDSMSGTNVLNLSANNSRAYSGTLLNGASLTTAGRFGKAVSLDGVNDYVSLSDNAIPLNSAGTLSIWFKTTDLQGGLMERRATPTGPRFVLASGTLYYSIDGTQVNSPMNVNDNKWHQVVGTWDSTTGRLYIDGVLVSSFAAGAPSTPAGGNTRIGFSDDQGYLAGSLDDARVYSRALSAREVNELYRWNPLGNGGTMLTTLRIESGASLAVVGTISGSSLRATSATGNLLQLKTNMSNGTSVFSIVSDNGSANNRVFNFQADGNAFADGAFTGGGADYAEYFLSSSPDLQQGELVCIDINKKNTVKRCDRDGDSNVIGIVSSRTQAAFIGNRFKDADGLPVPGTVLVGLIGQLKTSAIVENGNAIHTGDQLTPASIPGYARKAMAGEPTVGVALESLDAGKGQIQVLISRRNQSLTGEMVDQRVLDSMKSMGIDDEIQKKMTATFDAFHLDDSVRLAVEKQLQDASVTDRLATLEREVAMLGSAGGAGSGQRVAGSIFSGALVVTDLTASTLDLQETLSVGGDTRIGGDLYLEGTLNVSDLFVPGVMKVDGSLEANTLTIDSGATLRGPVTVYQRLEMASGSTLVFATGSTLNISTLLVRDALHVLGPITVNGLATFLGDVEVHGLLSVSSRQAGTLTISQGTSGATIIFTPAYSLVPVVNATPNGRVGSEWWIEGSSQSGFTIRTDRTVAADVVFSWFAVGTVLQSGTGGTLTSTGSSLLSSSSSSVSSSSTSSSVHGSLFPVDSEGIPISSNVAWNNCIRNSLVLDSDGKPLTCDRYHNGTTWTHPDLGIEFLWNTSTAPTLLTLPDGYEATFMGEAELTMPTLDPEQTPNSPATDGQQSSSSSEAASSVSSSPVQSSSTSSEIIGSSQASSAESSNSSANGGEVIPQ